MYKKIKAYFESIKIQNKQIISQNNEIIHQNAELIWAENYHDAIRGYSKIEELSLNIGRWAGSYTFFYLLFRILKDFQPTKILELGLGESSKFITTYLDFYLDNSRHLIVEQDEKWKNSFVSNYQLSKKSEIVICPTIIQNVRNFNVEVYNSFENIINEEFNFYLIDGPKGSEHYSRYDAFKIVQNINKNQDFLILIDDYNRKGEQETVTLLLKDLENREIKYYSAVYTGLKNVIIIASSKYELVKSL